MKIGIDVRPLSKRRTGIGNYVEGLVAALLQIAPEHEYFLYSNRLANTPRQQDQMRCRHRIEREFAWIPGSLWIFGRGAALSRRDDLKVLWLTSPVLPVRMPKNVRSIVTVYDLVWRQFPETMSRHTLWIYRAFAERAIHQADLVIAISDSTANDLSRLLGVNLQKIKVVYPGISSRYFPRNRCESANYIARKYNVPNCYMAAVGTLEPRKNLELLVKAVSLLKRGQQLKCPLVIAGAQGWKNSSLHRQIQTEGLGEDEIQFLGYVPDEDLALFYAGAQLFVFPSRYEGFGLPPIEAMACGTPVISSNAVCMSETLGGAALFESPDNPEGFATLMSRVLGDQVVHRELRIAGLERAKRYCWADSAHRMSAILQSFF